MDITKLKKVIQEAVPEIMELKMGCQFKFKDGHKDCVIAYHCPKYTDFYVYLIGIGWNYDSMQNKHLYKDIKILGRPITLHDIRLTLIKHTDHWGDRFREVSAMWNEINNLDEQSDICKSLLIRILVK